MSGSWEVAITLIILSPAFAFGFIVVGDWLTRFRLQREKSKIGDSAIKIFESMIGKSKFTGAGVTITKTGNLTYDGEEYLVRFELERIPS